MVVTARKRTPPPKGSAKPRLSPPVPARTDLDLFHETCRTLEIELIPSQEEVARYLYALGQGSSWLYREIAELMSRQNGKTEPLVPHIVTRLRMGRRIMHTAQDRTLPREVFERVVDAMVAHYSKELRGRPRLANGQESIRTNNGGRYRIVAPTRGGARGPSNDDLIIDEVRELDSFDFIAAAKPTLTASTNPQTLYLSNAGDDSSVVLNSIRLRAQTDPRLAYLEWSAGPERPADDREGWREANPAIGYLPGVEENLEAEYVSNKLAGTLAIFETEHLCRWVSTMRERLVDEHSWVLCHADAVVPPAPCLAVSMDPQGRRASVAVAGQRPDGSVALRLILEATGDPINTADLGNDIAKVAGKLKVKRIGFDPLTDRELVKFMRLPKPEPISGQLFANASAQFVNLVGAGRLQHAECDPVTDDLTWTSRKADTDTGTYQAVRAQDDRPITASLAAIRAVWLASGPAPAKARVM